MKAKKWVVILDVIIVAIMAISILAGKTAIGKELSGPSKLLAEKTDLSFNLIASPEETKVKAGATVEITLSVEDINIEKEGLNAVVGNLSYDETLFDSVEVNAEENWNIELNTKKDHSMYGKFCIYTMQEGVTENQNVVKMKMKLKDDLKPQVTKVWFKNLASSNGNVEVPEEDRVVTIIIYEDGEPIPEEPDEPEKNEPVQTGDNKILVILAIAVLTIILNVITFAKNKKTKVLSTVLVTVVGLSCLGIVSFAADNINVKDVINKLNIKQSWLNSEKYLVTDENVSRIAPGTKAEAIANKFNKGIVISKDGKEVDSKTVLGTGMKISVKNPSYKDAEGDYAYEVSVFGDTNGDGKSNQVELTRIIRNVVDAKKWVLSGAVFKSADFTVDNKIDEKDVNKSVRYIVYGELEIPEFDQVDAPIVEVVNGEFDEEGNCYTTDVEVRIAETAKNGIKTQYKIENSEGEVLPYTEISREVKNEDGKYERVINLKKGDIYKVSAYTTGELGNRSEIPYIIVNGIYNNLREYKVEYYYKGRNATEFKLAQDKTETGYAEIGSQITTYTDKNKLGYELATEKGTNGVEGLPLTIDKNKANNVIKVYYKIVQYEINYNPNGGDWTDGVNPNPPSYNVEDPDIIIINPDRPGYTCIGWTEDDEDEPENPKIIHEGTTGPITITAEWKVINYNIEYKNITPEERSSINNPKTYTIEDTVQIKHAEDRNNATFEGWTGNGLTEKTKDFAFGPGEIGDRVYTANWENGEEPVTTVYDITAEAVDVNGQPTNKADISGLPAQVNAGEDLENNIAIVTKKGYIAMKFMLYSKEKTETEFDDSTGIDITNSVARGPRINYIVNYFTNVQKDYHLVVTVEEKEYAIVAQIVGVPEGYERKNNPYTGEQILNNEYSTIEEALNDAAYLNGLAEKEAEEHGEVYDGQVEIKLIAENDEITEQNTVVVGNNVILDLNDHQVIWEDDYTFIVEDGASLVVKDGSEVDGTDGQNGKIINETGTGVIIEAGGTLEVGTNDDIQSSLPSTTCPVIKGGTYSVQNNNTAGDDGEFNFYDGVLASPEDPVISGNVNNTPEYYSATSTEIDGDSCYILQVTANYEAELAGQRYVTLEDAFKEVNNKSKYTLENPARINVIADHVVKINEGSDGICEVNANKNVILDLNGRTVTYRDGGFVTSECIKVNDNAKLKIQDSSATARMDQTYTQLVNDDANYNFKIANNTITPNNIGETGTTAKSHIVIDLEEKEESENFELNLTLIKSMVARDSGDGFKAYITTEAQRPATITNDMYVYNDTPETANGKIIESKKVLQGNHKYYLYFDYKARPDEAVRILGVTLDNKDLLQDVIIPKGKLVGQIEDRGTVEINNAFVNSAISNSQQNGGVLEVNNAILAPQFLYNTSIIDTITVNNSNVGMVNEPVSGRINNLYGKEITITDSFCGGVFTQKDTIPEGTYKIDVNNSIINDLYASRNTKVNNHSYIIMARTAVPGDILIKDSTLKYMELRGGNNNKLENVDGVEGLTIVRDVEESLNIKESNIKAINTEGFERAYVGEINIESGNIGTINTTKATPSGSNIVFNIFGGTVESTDIAIKANESTTVNLGNKEDGSVSTTTPKVKGTNAGIQGACTVNFYDGVIVAPKNKALDGVTMGETAEDLSILNEQATEEGTNMYKYYLGLNTTNVARISDNTEGLVESIINNAAKCEHNTADNYYYFKSLKDAIDACGDNKAATIQLVENNMNIQTEVTVPANKIITIDLAGNSITMNQLTNNGDLTIDSTETTVSNVNAPITNNGKLTLNKGAYNGAIINNNEMTFNGTALLGTTTGNNNSVTTINSGTVDGNLIGNVGSEIVINNNTVFTANSYRERNSKGTVTINGASYMGSFTVEDGTLNMDVNNQGRYDSIICKGSTQSTIKNATITNLTVESANGAEMTLENSTIAYMRNGENSKVTCAGNVGIAYIQNSGEFIIPEGCTFSNPDITDNTGYHVARQIENQLRGKLTLGTKNGTVMNGEENATTINISATLTNDGTLYFYDGRVTGNYTVGTGAAVETEDGYTIQTDDNVTRPMRMSYNIEVAASSVNPELIGNVSNVHDQENNVYRFLSIKDAASVIKDNEEATLKVTEDVTYTSAKESDEIGASKKVVLELDGHKLIYTGTNSAIVNNGELTIKDSKAGNEGLISAKSGTAIENAGKLVLNSGNYACLELKTQANDIYLIKNTGNTEIGANAKIEGNGLTQDNSNKGTIANLEDGKIAINATGISGYVPIVNNSTSSNSNAGITIDHYTNTKTSITNETGYLTIESCPNLSSDSNTSTVVNKDKLTIKNSTISTIEGASTAEGSVINVESGTVGVLKGKAETIVIGKSTDAFDAENVTINSYGDWPYTVSAENVYFNSGVIKSKAYATGNALIIPNGAKLVSEQEGTIYKTTLVPMGEDEYEAQIGDNKYKYLKDAAEYCNEHQDDELTVKVLTDVIITSGREVTFEGNNVTLDLDGHTITKASSNEAIVNNGTLKISGNNSGTFNDVCPAATGKYFMTNNGTLNINSRTEESGKYTIFNNVNGELNVKDSSLKGTIAYGDAATTNIDNSKISEMSGVFEMYQELTSVTTIKNGSEINNITVSGTVDMKNSTVTGKASTSTYQIGLLKADNCDIYKIDGPSVEIKNSRLKVVRASGTIENSTITSPNSSADAITLGQGAGYALVSLAGTLKNCEITNTNVQNAVYVSSELTIIGGTIESVNNGVYVEGATSSTPKLVLGEDDRSIDYTDNAKPYIHGQYYGIIQRVAQKITGYKPTGQVYIYDGIVKGDTKAMWTHSYLGRYDNAEGPIITGVAFLHEVKKSTDEKEIRLALKGSYQGVVSVAGVEFELAQIDSAISQAINNNATIKVINGFALTQTLNIFGNLDTNTEITIDLNGKTIEGDIAGALINNKVTLNIVDTVGGGFIRNYNANGVAIDNTGVLNIGATGAAQGPKIISHGNAINNSASAIVTLNKGIIAAVNTPVVGGTLNPSTLVNGTFTENAGTEGEITFNTKELAQ